MAYSAMTTAEIAVGKPITNDLLTKVKGNFDWLYGQAGAQAGASVANGGFEIDSDADGTPDNWTAAVYAGGTKSRESSGAVEGTYCMKFIHPGGAGNGGGYLQSDYIPMSQVINNVLSFGYYASAAGMKCQAQMLCYDYAQSLLGTLTLYTSTANPTAWTLVVLNGLMLYSATVKWCKIKLIGGYTDTDVAGNVFFDDVRLSLVSPTAQQIALSETINVSVAGNSGTAWADVSGPYAITVPTWAKTLRAAIKLTSPNSDNALHARLKIGTTYGTDVTGTAALVQGVSVLDVSALSGAQNLYYQGYYTPGSGGTYALYSTTADQQKSYTYRVRTVDYEEGTTTDG